MSGNERSLSELQRDAVKSRANLTVTVGQLRSKMSDTVDDIRQRISPDAIKAGASDYFRSRNEQLMAKARDNPLQAAAIGVGLAYPVLRMVRSVPAPVLMVGAGLFLMGTTSGKRATQKIAETAESVTDRISAGTDAVSRGAHDLQDSVSQGLVAAKGAASSAADMVQRRTIAAKTAFVESASQLKERGAALISTTSDSITGLTTKAGTVPDLAAGAMSDGASAAGEFMGDTAASATDFGTNSALQIRDGVIQASQRATKLISETIQQNPLLVGGIGLAVGALIAGALPRSDVERGLMGEASADVQKRASHAASQGFEAAKDMATGVIRDVADKAEEQGLSADGLADAAGDIGRRARHVAENAATTAFELANKATTTPKRGSLL